jgi:hypothetical protein
MNGQVLLTEKGQESRHVPSTSESSMPGVCLCRIVKACAKHI